MAKKKSNKSYLYFVLIFVGLIAFLYGSQQLYLFTGRVLFWENERFVVNVVNLKTAENGYWFKKKASLIKLMKVELGATNLFDIDVEEAKQLLMFKANIESAIVERVLPDTLNVTIQERVPRAYLIFSKQTVRKEGTWLPKWVVDSKCVLMKKSSCMNLGRSIPLIYCGTEFGKLSEGDVYAKVKPAVDLMVLSMGKYYSSFRIDGVSLKSDGNVLFSLYLKDRKHRKAFVITLPRKGDYDKYLEMTSKYVRDILDKEAGMIRAGRLSASDTLERRINLSFEGQVIVRD